MQTGGGRHVPWSVLKRRPCLGWGEGRRRGCSPSRGHAAPGDRQLGGTKQHVCGAAAGSGRGEACGGDLLQSDTLPLRFVTACVLSRAATAERWLPTAITPTSLPAPCLRRQVVGRSEPHNLKVGHPTQNRTTTIRENARMQVRRRAGRGRAHTQRWVGSGRRRPPGRHPSQRCPSVGLVLRRPPAVLPVPVHRLSCLRCSTCTAWYRRGSRTTTCSLPSPRRAPSGLAATPTSPSVSRWAQGLVPNLPIARCHGFSLLFSRLLAQLLSS